MKNRPHNFCENQLIHDVIFVAALNSKHDNMEECLFFFQDQVSSEYLKQVDHTCFNEEIKDMSLPNFLDTKLNMKLFNSNKYQMALIESGQIIKLEKEIIRRNFESKDPKNLKY